MGRRIVHAIGWLLLEFEARMVTLMIWVCWICGITTDEVERARDKRKHLDGSASTTDNPQPTAEPRLSSRTAPLHKRNL